MSTIAVEAKLRALELEMREASRSAADPPVGIDERERRTESAVSSSTDVAETADHDANERMGRRGKVGVGLLVGGGSAIGIGVGLLIRKPRNFPTGHVTADKIETTRPTGGVVLAGGVALAATGAVLLALDLKGRARTVADVRPWFLGGGAGIGISGRF